MRTITTKFTIITATAVVFALTSAGCQDEQDSKRDRLYAAENMELKVQLQQKNAKLESRQSQLEQCSEENRYLKEEHEERTGQLLQALMFSIGQQQESLKAENAELQAQIEQLKSQTIGHP